MRIDNYCSDQSDCAASSRERAARSLLSRIAQPPEGIANPELVILSVAKYLAQFWQLCIIGRDPYPSGILLEAALRFPVGR